MTERFILDDAGTLIDMQTRDTFDYVSEVCPLMNVLYEEKEQLKQRLKALDDAFMDFEQKLYLEVFDIQLSKEDEKIICEYLQLIGEEMLKKDG